MNSENDIVLRYKVSMPVIFSGTIAIKNKELLKKDNLKYFAEGGTVLNLGLASIIKYPSRVGSDFTISSKYYENLVLSNSYNGRQFQRGLDALSAVPLGTKFSELSVINGDSLYPLISNEIIDNKAIESISDEIDKISFNNLKKAVDNLIKF